MKNVLRRIEFLVIAAGFWRESRYLWNKKSLEYRYMKEIQGILRCRRNFIKSYFIDNDIVKLQIGAGTNPIRGWINSDLEPTSDDIIYLNALEEFPFDDQIVDYIFSEHMIEHINYRDGLFMLRECYRIMKPNGKIRISTPDAEKITGLYNPEKTTLQKRYLEWSSKVGIGLYSFEKSEMKKRRPEWDIDPVHINNFFPNASEDTVCFVVNNLFRSYGHQFLYDIMTLTAAMNETGFRNIRTYTPGESDDTNLRGLEMHQKSMGEELYRFETMVLEGVRS